MPGLAMVVLQRDFLPADLLPLLEAKYIDSCVSFQVDQSKEETHFLLQLVTEKDFIKGVESWIVL